MVDDFQWCTGGVATPILQITMIHSYWAVEILHIGDNMRGDSSVYGSATFMSNFILFLIIPFHRMYRVAQKLLDICPMHLLYNVVLYRNLSLFTWISNENLGAHVLKIINLCRSINPLILVVVNFFQVIAAWISNYIHQKVWYGINYPYQPLTFRNAKVMSSHILLMYDNLKRPETGH